MATAVLVMKSPVGLLELTSNGLAITRLLFLDAEIDREVVSADDDDPVLEPMLAAARAQLDAYFAGELEEFDLPLAAHGTEFQQRVWHELESIPYGVTASYGDIARRLGMHPGASRAVGLANGSNPIAIVVPCHRVIGADGTLTGYGGGLARKRYLLDLESRDLLFV